MSTSISSQQTLARPSGGAVRWTASSARSARAFLRRAAAFLLVGAVLYSGAYAWSERLVYEHARRNRFFVVHSAPNTNYDVVVLGSSHAAVFDYDDMTATLEALTDASILNLSVTGAGVVVNRLLLDYFLERRRARAVVYVVDSFTFTARTWNEERVQDARLFARAPFDFALARLLWETPGGRSVVLPYLSGFQKVNNADRYRADVSDDETSRFDRTYRPVKQIDDQRLSYLYPETAMLNAGVRDRYLSLFEALVSDSRAAGLAVVIVKPPLPERVYRALPDESAFDERITSLAARHGAQFHDFSMVNNDDKLFYDTDHLNREGVTRFFESHFAPLLRATLATAAPR